MNVNFKHHRQHYRQHYRQHWMVRGRRGRRQGGLPGPLKVDVPMFFVLTTTTLPGPLAAARGEVRGT